MNTEAHTLIFRSFYIDIGRMSPEKTTKFLETMKKDLRDEQQIKIEKDLEGRVTFIDHWIPVPSDSDGARRGSRIDVQPVFLPGEIK